MPGDFGVGFHSTVRLKTLKYVGLSPHTLLWFLSFSVSRSPFFFYYPQTTEQARADLQFHVTFA